MATSEKGRDMAELASEHLLAYQGDLGALKLRFAESPKLATMKDLVNVFCATQVVLNFLFSRLEDC